MDGEWQSYPDSTIRETYPVLPSRGGSPNKEASDSVIGAVVSQVQLSQHREAEFRARQHARRLHTRGAAAMREPEESLPSPQLVIPDDPELAEYKAAGWFG